MPVLNKNIDLFIHPRSDKRLIRYLNTLREHYKWIDLIDTGITKPGTLAIIESDYLFVTPKFCKTYIDPQQDLKSWPDREDLGQMLSQYPQTFLLGDPGCGKTTFMQRMATVFCDLMDNAINKKHGYLIPFLITLRDVKSIGKLKTFDALIDQYLTSPLFEKEQLTKELYRRIALNGQAFFLFDGLDEINAIEDREPLAKVIKEGLKKYKHCHFWITSRIVGFDQEQFFEGDSKNELDWVFEDESISLLGDYKTRRKKSLKGGSKEFKLRELEQHNIASDSATPVYGFSHAPVSIPELYFSPFDNEQMKQFAKYWFHVFESKEKHRQDTIDKFIDDLKQKESITHLARLPLMLTMMGLLYQINRDFPDGRVELYQKITSAYLSDINRKRNIPLDRALTYEEQMDCLGQLAIELQLKRENDDNKQHLTINRKDAEKVFINTLDSKHTYDNPKDIVKKVKAFFDSLEKRSEILIPKGIGEYGFLHLSYQEFFAADALRKEFEFYQKRGHKSAYKERAELLIHQLKHAAAHKSWHETIVLFFEGFRNERENLVEDCRDAFDLIYNWDRETGGIDSMMKNLESAAKVMTNSYICDNFDLGARHELLDQLFIYQQRFPYRYSDYLKNWGKQKQIFIDLSEKVTENLLNVRWIGASKKKINIKVLEQCKHAVVINLSSTHISDLGPLSQHKQLQYLDLSSTQVCDLSPLSQLKQLQTLILSNTQISDLSPISQLKQLRELYLAFTQINDFSPISQYKQLKVLDLSSTPIKDLSPLGQLKQLRTLYMHSTHVSDLSPLNQLKQLQYVDLMSTQVNDLSPLKQLKQLRYLRVDAELNTSSLHPNIAIIST